MLFYFNNYYNINMCVYNEFQIKKRRYNINIIVFIYLIKYPLLVKYYQAYSFQKVFLRNYYYYSC